MANQQLLKGYRQLSQGEIDTLNRIKDKAEEISVLFDELEGAAPDQRWLAIARTTLQQGFMFLIRAIAKPESF